MFLATLFLLAPIYISITFVFVKNDSLGHQKRENYYAKEDVQEKYFPFSEPENRLVVKF